MTETDAKTLAIVLTDRVPVRIREDDWPVVAEGGYDRHDGQIRGEANRVWLCRLEVREHADGRRIVSGRYSYSTSFRGAEGFESLAGELIEAGCDVVATIRRVGEAMNEHAVAAGHDFWPHILEATRNCIADLPPQDI